MKAENVVLAAPLVEALKVLPKVKTRLRDKPKPPLDGMTLELSAAEMQDGEGQGSNAYFYLPAELGQKVLDFAEDLIAAELKRLGVKL